MANTMGQPGRSFDPAILDDTTPRGPAHRIATVVVKNKAGTVLRINTEDVDAYKAKGYSPTDEKSLVAAGFQSAPKTDYALTESDFEAYTVNELRVFCEDAKPSIDFKSNWNKPDFIAALLQAKFTPLPDGE